MTPNPAKPVCVGCRRQINMDLYRDALGDVWHALCWQREANLFYEDRALDADPAGEQEKTG